jgi:hypothetical protein
MLFSLNIDKKWPLFRRGLLEAYRDSGLRALLLAAILKAISQNLCAAFFYVNEKKLL